MGHEKQPRIWLLAPALLAAFLSCRNQETVAPPIDGPALVRLEPSHYPSFEDLYEKETLIRAIDRQLAWLGARKDAPPWSFGSESFSAAHMIATLERFKTLWRDHFGQPQALREAIQAEFQVYQLVWNGEPEILFTGYHSPIYPGRLTHDERFRHPLYRLPHDIVAIRTGRFSPKMLSAGPGLRDDRVMARVDARNGEVLPYYSRTEIDAEHVLAGRGLELVYLERYFDAFLFHVQGGGFIELEDGTFIKLDFAGKNGHPYTSIGKALVAEGKIPEAEISVQAIEKYFAAHPDEVLRVCFQNQSYVFYETDGRRHRTLAPEMFPHGFLGFPVTPKRSIAMDKRYFPGGALAFIEGSQRLETGGAKRFGAFVIDQDTGGAIKDNHIDFYHGAGAEAESLAGLLKDEHGRVYFLVLKKQTGT